MKNLKLHILTLLIIVQFPILAQEVIEIGADDLLTKYLREGKKQYLVYIEKPDKSIMDISIYERAISFSRHGNEDVIIIEQHWKNQDNARQRYIYSINRHKNFQPIYHYSKNGRGTIDAFNFKPNEIIGADSIANNSKREFQQVLTEPTLNWELDLETFQMLPFEKGKKFKINFYHPGNKREPKFYDYNVVGIEDVKDLEGGVVACWLLKIVYSEGSHATFWISKKNREVIKMFEESNGLKVHKLKLMSTKN